MVDSPLQKLKQKARSQYSKMLCSCVRCHSIPPAFGLQASCCWTGHSQNCWRNIWTAHMYEFDRQIFRPCLKSQSANLISTINLNAWKLIFITYLRKRKHAAPLLNTILLVCSSEMSVWFSRSPPALRLAHTEHWRTACISLTNFSTWRIYLIYLGRWVSCWWCTLFCNCV